MEVKHLDHHSLPKMLAEANRVTVSPVDGN